MDISKSPDPLVRWIYSNIPPGIDVWEACRAVCLAGREHIVNTAADTGKTPAQLIGEYCAHS